MAGDAMTAAAAAAERDDALEDFTGKWRAHWPESVVAEVRAARPARHRAGLGQPAAGTHRCRLGLQRCRRRRSQARLVGRRIAGLGPWPAPGRGLALQRQPAPWKALAVMLPSLRDSRERQGDRNEAFEMLTPLAEAIGAIDLALFGPVPGPSAEAAMAPILSSLLEARLVLQGDAAVPLSVVARTLARPQAEGAAAEWSAELLAQWPARGGSTVPRRLWTALAHTRLQRGDAARPLSPWTALLAAWRGARN